MPSWLKPVAVIFVIMILFLVQTSFFSGSGTLLSLLNFFWLAVIWLRFRNSVWVWAFVVFGGLLLDLQQGLFGVNLITLFALALLISFLRKTIATTGRFIQFLLISLLGLVGAMLVQLFLIWAMIKFFADGLAGATASFGLLVNINRIIPAVAVNLAVLLGFYIFLKKTPAV